MILFILILILIFGGILAWIAGSVNSLLSRWITVITVLACFFIVLGIWINKEAYSSENSGWIIEYTQYWIDRFGIQLHLALDGLSILLLELTFFLGLLAIFASWSQIKHRTGFFHLNLLWVLAGISGVFLSVDMFLFYFFWEVMLVPMYFLIGIWGFGGRIYAAYKFFIFTQLSGLLMFLAILTLYFIHAMQTGTYTFEYSELMNTALSKPLSILLFLGFLIAFFVKLPIVPFHSWLPESYTEAPTAGSIILSGILSKTAAYGLLRFAIPFFPKAVSIFAPYLMALGALTILYGAKLAFAQSNIKRLVAYTSVSHMGFIILGVFALNELAYQGVVMQIIAHGFGIGALFILTGALQEKNNTLNIEAYGGLWSKAPKMGGIGLILALALLGLPGMASFVAEFLTLIGAFQSNVLVTAFAVTGFIVSVIYALKLFQRIFYGEVKNNEKISDFNIREMLIIFPAIAVIFWLGLFPGTVFQTSEKPVLNILEYMKRPEAEMPPVHKKKPVVSYAEVITDKSEPEP